MSNLDKITRDFVLSEGRFQEPSARSFIQALEENIMKMEPRTHTEMRRKEMAMEQIKGIKRQTRKIEERLNMLEEENKQLHERIALDEVLSEDRANDHKE